MNPKILCLLVLLMASGYLPSVAATYEELNRSFSDGDLQRVIKLAEADVKKDPTSIDALYFLGVAYERLDQHDKAIRVLTRFEKVHDVVERKQKNEQAPGSTADFLLVDARYSPAYFLLGQHYVKTSNFSRAERHLRRAKARYINDPMLNFYLGLASLQLSKFEESRKYFRRMMELDPKDPSPLYNIAATYAREGKSREALDWLKRAVDARPQYREEASVDADFSSLKQTEEFKRLISK